MFTEHLNEQTAIIKTHLNDLLNVQSSGGLKRSFDDSRASSQLTEIAEKQSTKVSKPNDETLDLPRGSEEEEVAPGSGDASMSEIQEFFDGP